MALLYVHLHEYTQQRIGRPMKNVKRRSGAAKARSFLDAFTGSGRLPPDVLDTWWERVLAVVAIVGVVWLVVDIFQQGL